MAKKDIVAGSTQEPAIKQETNTGAAPDAGNGPVLEVVTFPRDVAIVNETAMDYVIARTFVKAGTSALVSVNDADEITRMETDCKQIMSLNDSYAGLEISPLRVIEAQ